MSYNNKLKELEERIIKLENKKIIYINVLSEDQIKEYQQLFKKQGKEITVEEAEEIDNTFRALAEIIYEQYISDLKQNKKGLDMKDTIWLPITEFLKNNRKLNLLSQLSNSQVFEITEITNDYIKIQFQDSKGDLKIERSRFVSAYKMLEEKKGVWVEHLGQAEQILNPTL